MLHLAFDQLTSCERGLPNLAIWRAMPYTDAWRQYDQHWPYVVPLRLELFLREFCMPVSSHNAIDAPPNSWYPIAIAWWDFEIDYVDLIPEHTKDLIRRGHLRLLFYYHEGDNPARIRERIDYCLCKHNLFPSKTLLISGNCAANLTPGCVYFDDFQCWFSVLNKHQIPSAICRHTTRQFNFTVLSRTHKWWRATIMHDLRQAGILDRSIWGYGDVNCGDCWQDNPIECEDNKHGIQQFVDNGPYAADSFCAAQQNDHHYVNNSLYNHSHFSIVLETHFDADQSNGSFLTEKTYKCIKYGQPFFIAGTAGSLQILRDHGYRVFDHVLDNSYDLEKNNTRRWHKLFGAIRQTHSDIENQSAACQSDVEHNQQLFVQSPKHALNKLLERLR